MVPLTVDSITRKLVSAQRRRRRDDRCFRCLLVSEQRRRRRDDRCSIVSEQRQASLLDPPVPRDHVEDVPVTFTLIPGGSQKGKDLLRILISLYRAETLSTSGLLKRCSTFYRPLVPKRPEEVEMNE
ncbi:hypothetical protein DPMN_016349 [Dreissena polymorpha]|uniref:Uncharacterized protein n=1 Tax=Dreissena polymorpha TaxID=45954 RepID=A0A9D4NB45_DREPO|nr:hypothetical protein DPMN_016349 [Dreissena polymorpha]